MTPMTQRAIESGTLPWARTLVSGSSAFIRVHRAKASARMTRHVNLIETFVRRPVATTLLTVGVALAGIVAFSLLPVSPLPQVDFPTMSV